MKQKKKLHLFDRSPSSSACEKGLLFDNNWSIQIDANTTDIGFMMWVNIDPARTADLWKNRIIGGEGWHVNLTHNKFNLHVDGPGDQLNGNTILTPGKWWFIGVRWAGTSLRLIIGNEQGNIVETVNNTATLPGGFTYGIEDVGEWGGWKFQGSIDEIMLWGVCPAGLDTYMDTYWNTNYPLGSSPANDSSSLLAYIRGDDAEDNDTSVTNSAGTGPANYSLNGSGLKTVSGAPPYCDNPTNPPPPPPNPDPDPDPDPDPPNGDCRVLHLTKTSGYNHGTAGASIAMMNQIAQDLGLQVVHDGTGSNFDNLNNLRTFDVVYLSNTSGDFLNSQQRANFEIWINEGGSVISNHAAADAFFHSSSTHGGSGVWDFYAEKITGYTIGNPKHSNYQQLTIDHIGSHELLSNIPDPWTIYDEGYYTVNGYVNSNFTEILRLQSTGGGGSDGPRMSAHYWERPDGGKSFFTGIGHDAEKYQDSNFRQLMKNAFAWACEVSEPDPGELRVEGERKRWHKIAVMVPGENVNENDGNNPFKNYRLRGVFTHQGTGKTYTVRGHYAADGNAANTSANSGDQWRIYFQPDETGTWNCQVSFRKGNNIALSESQTGDPVVNDGAQISFNIGETNKTGSDYRYKGRRQKQSNKFHFQYIGSGRYHLRSAVGAPENFLAYYEFDNTYDNGGLDTPGMPDGLHHYDIHLQHFQAGNPTWDGKGQRIIGALNYLAQYVNGLYIIMHTTNSGDGMDVWPWTTVSAGDRYDVSKLDQWEIVFSHADALGLELQLFFHEIENQGSFGGGLSDNEKLYIQEMLSRFAHHDVMWNVGEECSISDNDKQARLNHINEYHPYFALRTFHTRILSEQGAGDYDSFVNGNSLNATSIQNHINQFEQDTLNLRSQSQGAGGYLAIYHDEQTTPVSPSNGNLFDMRKTQLNNLMSGGAGVSYWFGYQGTFGDVQTEDFTQIQPLLQQTKRITDFFQGNIPFQDMTPNHDLVNGSHLCLHQNGIRYLVWTKNGGSSTLDLQGNSATFNVKWFDPRSGGGLQNGSVTSITGPGVKSLGNPPNNTGSDWLCLVGDPSTPPDPPPGGCEADYETVNGLATIYAHNLNFEPTNWNLSQAHSGYTGPGFIKYDGNDYPNTPGNEIIPFTVKFNDAGIYRIQFRHIIAEGNSNTDHNDTWLKVEGLGSFYASNGEVVYYPHGSGQTPNPQGPGGLGYFKIFFNFLPTAQDNFYWLTQTSDNEIDYWIFVEVDSPGQIGTFKLSGRSAGYGIDRIAVWHTSLVSGAQAININNQETPCTGNPPPDPDPDPDPPPPPSGGAKVIAICVDGLRSDIIENLGSSVPNMQRMITEGASTLNARTDFDYTTTLPNVVSMLCSRPVLGPYGHNYFNNDDPGSAAVIAPSIFQRLTSEGYVSAAYVSKTKLRDLFQNSWGDTNQIDQLIFDSVDSEHTEQFIFDLDQIAPQFAFIHYRKVDNEGDNSGFTDQPNTPYATDVISVDGFLGDIMEAIEDNPDYNGNTYIILTSTHGGSGTDHSNQSIPENFTIPFLVWGADTAQGRDLYELNNGQRVDPGEGRIVFDNEDALQPIYNGDLGNLSLYLLGIANSINSSAINENYSLNVRATISPPDPPTGSVRNFGDYHGSNWVLDGVSKDWNDLVKHHGRLYADSRDYAEPGQPNNLYTDPILGIGGAYSWQTEFRDMLDAGYKNLMVCMKGNPAYAPGLTDSIIQYHSGHTYNHAGPSNQHGHSADPDSYDLHAGFHLQILQRIHSYGRENHPVTYLAIYNEDEEWWKGGQRNFTYNAPSGYQINESRAQGDWAPEEMCALLTKVWRIGRQAAETAGIKIVPAGRVGFDPNNLQRWADYIRDHNDGDPPFHGFCIHYYRNDKHAITEYYAHGTDYENRKGSQPEAHINDGTINGQPNVPIQSMREHLQSMVDRIRAIADQPGMSERWRTIEIHFTEWGYDINPGSIQSANMSGRSGQEAQSLFLLRSQFMFMAVQGITGANQFFYMHSHSDGLNDPSVYASSGYKSGGASYDPPMLSWYHWQQVRAILDPMVCTSWDEDPQVHNFRFDGGGKTVFVLWRPTVNNSVTNNYVLNSGGSGTAIKYSLQGAGNFTAAQQQLPITNGQINVGTVTESPIFIEVANATNVVNGIGGGSIAETFEIG